MDGVNVAEVIERLFSDIIGAIIPGMLLIFGIWMVLGQPCLFGIYRLHDLDHGFSWLLLIAGGYAVGHLITSIGMIILKPCVEAVSGVLRACCVTARLVPRTVIPLSQLMQDIENSPNYRAMVSCLTKTRSWLVHKEYEGDVRSWRNIAMSLVPEQNHVVPRFMFISHLNLGVATAVWIIVVLWFLFSIPSVRGWLSLPISPPEFRIWPAIGTLAISLFFIERSYDFYSRSMRVPFAMAVAKLLQSGNDADE